jgi:hypothetical protein
VHLKSRMYTECMPHVLGESGLRYLQARVPLNVYEGLQERARRHRRSMNQEIVTLILDAMAADIGIGRTDRAQATRPDNNDDSYSGRDVRSDHEDR